MIRRMRRPASNPNGPGYTPGITSAGVAGQTPPELQGLPVLLPPADLPGRRHLLDPGRKCRTTRRRACRCPWRLEVTD
jgi:hypothetical protein